MNIKLIVALTIAAALAAGFLLSDKDNNQTADDLQIESEPTPTGPASAESTQPLQLPDEALNAASEKNTHPIEIHSSQNAEAAVEPPRWPDGIENLIYGHFAQLEGFEFVSLNSVNCEPQTCEIVFSGTNPNPKFVDNYSGVMRGLSRPPINAQRGNIGTREIAAGANEFVINISNVPYIEPTVKQ